MMIERLQVFYNQLLYPYSMLTNETNNLFCFFYYCYRSEYSRSSVLDELHKISDMLRSVQDSDKIQINIAHFTLLYLQFVTEWRCGCIFSYFIPSPFFFDQLDNNEAFNAAINAIQFCKENLQSLAIR